MICEVKSRILALDNGVVMSVAGIAAAIFAAVELSSIAAASNCSPSDHFTV